MQIHIAVKRNYDAIFGALKYFIDLLFNTSEGQENNNKKGTHEN